MVFFTHNKILTCFLEAKFDILVTGYSASNMFLLVCVALNGFYALTSYDWFTVQPEGPCIVGKTALLYTKQADTFTCHVKDVNKTILAEVKFQTSGELILL